LNQSRCAQAPKSFALSDPRHPQESRSVATIVWSPRFINDDSRPCALEQGRRYSRVRGGYRQVTTTRKSILRFGKIHFFDLRGMPRTLDRAVGDGLGVAFVFSSFVVHDDSVVDE
jgi:hypothetical protein